MRLARWTIVAAFSAMAAACGGSTPAPAADAARGSTPAAPEHKYLLERIDDAAVVQLYADGFRALPLQEKTLLWHLSQAALAGRDIFYDQRYAHNLEMRDVLEAIVAHPAGVRRGDARRDPPLHEALLDQHRALQQPHRAQVRAPVHARGVRRGRARGREGRRDVPAARTARRSTACSRACTRCSSIRRSIRRSRARRRRRGRTSSRRARTTCTAASRWRISRATTRNTRSTRGS